MGSQVLATRLEEIRRLLDQPNVDEVTRNQLEELESELVEALALQTCSPYPCNMGKVSS